MIQVLLGRKQLFILNAVLLIQVLSYVFFEFMDFIMAFYVNRQNIRR